MATTDDNRFRVERVAFASHRAQVIGDLHVPRDVNARHRAPAIGGSRRRR